MGKASEQIAGPAVSEDLSDTYPDVFPACAVTRAQARNKESAVNLSDSFILPLFAGEEALDAVVPEKTKC